MKRTSRANPVSNRNTVIMANFAKSRVGSIAGIFDNLPYPTREAGRNFHTAEEYHTWEHGWHSYESFNKAYRRLRRLFGPNTYAECGATVTKFKSWGIFEDIKYLSGGIQGILAAVPKLNESFNDLKDFIIVRGPSFNHKTGKIQCRFVLRPHDDFDPDRDYISDPHTRNILKQIPTSLGIGEAMVSQPLLPYDLFRLCNDEPEFQHLDLNPSLRDDTIFIRDPISEEKILLARKVVLLEDKTFHHEYLCGDPLLTGEYRSFRNMTPSGHTGFRLERSLATRDAIIFPSGTIIGAPYFIIDFKSDKEGSTFTSLRHLIKSRLGRNRDMGRSLLRAIEQVADENREKKAAFERLSRAKEEIEKAHGALADHAALLEQKVGERTRQLKELNRELENKVEEQLARLTQTERLKWYLPPQVVQSVLRGEKQVDFATERRKLTIFFSDVVNFTETIDSMEAEDLLSLVNEYLGEMTRIAHKWGGTIDKFIGDAIMIFFGAPEATDDRNHALRCVRMALEMQQEMKKLQQKWYEEGIEVPLQARMGINTGMATVGNFGSPERLSYTAIGGQVNLASRLEKHCEVGEILISHPTWAFVKDTLECLSCGKIRVKGIHRNLQVYTVKCSGDQ